MNRKLKLEELNRLDVQEFKEADKLPVIVVLDNIRSLSNVGAFFRICDAFRIEKLILGGITGKPPHREIQRTAIGATESVIWEHHADLNLLLHSLKTEGYQIVSVEQTENSEKLDRTSLKGKLCLIFGNEVEGVQQELIDLSDRCIEIPQAGTKHSLNVSVAAGVVLWEVFRQSNLVFY